jgi:hypothetical protein
MGYMNSTLIIAAVLCFLVSAASLYRSKTLPPDKKVGGLGIYIDKLGYRWYGIIGFVLGLAVLIMAFLI